MPEEKLPLSPYVPDAGDDIAYYYIDEHNLCVTYSRNKGIGDAIGRTMRAYLLTNDIKLLEGIINLWQLSPEHNNKLVGIRHPDYVEAEDKPFFHLGARMSRDHYIYTLVALRLFEIRTGKRHPKHEEIVKATPFGIRSMARWTLGLILWSKASVGNKTALFLSLILDLVMINLLYVPLRKLGDKICGWENEMDQEEWATLEHHTVQTNSQFLPKWKQKISKIIYPSYAIQFSCYQLYVTPDTFPKLKKTLQKSILKMVGNTNYVQQMFLGKKDIPRDKVEAFKTMKGGRWSGYLNNRNDRNMQVLPDGQETVNLMDVDLVRFLYNETQID